MSKKKRCFLFVLSMTWRFNMSQITTVPSSNVWTGCTSKWAFFSNFCLLLFGYSKIDVEYVGILAWKWHFAWVRLEWFIRNTFIRRDKKKMRCVCVFYANDASIDHQFGTIQTRKHIAMQLRLMIRYLFGLYFQN